MEKSVNIVAGQRNTRSELMDQMIGEVKKHGMKARGRKELIFHLSGKPLHRGQAILGMCYSCSGYYSDGKVDCLMPLCPLYGFMPYRGRKDE